MELSFIYKINTLEDIQKLKCGGSISRALLPTSEMDPKDSLRYYSKHETPLFPQGPPPGINIHPKILLLPPSKGCHDNASENKSSTQKLSEA